MDKELDGREEYLRRETIRTYSSEIKKLDFANVFTLLKRHSTLNPDQLEAINSKAMGILLDTLVGEGKAFQINQFIDVLDKVEDGLNGSHNALLRKLRNPGVKQAQKAFLKTYVLKKKKRGQAWRKVMPLIRMQFTLKHDRDMILIVSQYISRSILLFDPINAQYSKLVDMPGMRYECGVAFAEGFLFLIGGWKVYDTEQHEVLNPITENVKYNVRDRQFTAIASLPLYMDNTVQLARFQQSIYAIDDKGSVAKYNIETDEWSEAPSLEINWRGDSCSVAVVGHRIYVCGGWDLTKHCALNSVEYLDVDQEQAGWKTTASMMNKRSNAGAVSIDDRLHIIGGHDGSRFQYLGTMETYDPDRNTWSRIKQPMISARQGIGAAVIDQKVYIGGGMERMTSEGAIESERRLSKEMHSFNTQTKKWRNEVEMPEEAGLTRMIAVKI